MRQDSGWSFRGLGGESRLLLCSILVLIAGCSAPAEPEPLRTEPTERLEWAIAIHGGAGSTPRSVTEQTRQAYLDSLNRTLELGKSVLAQGGTSLDAVERVVAAMEDDPLFNAGKGAVFNHDGKHELDASIMDGRTLAGGGVAAVRTAKNPVKLARLVMERTPHVLLAADGAERFADETGVERVPNEWFDTERRRRTWQEHLERAETPAESPTGTVGAVALDRDGNLAAATSTGGLTGKRYGRVGDSPILGAGNYADNSTCAVSGTGTGEEFIRHAIAFRVSVLMEYADMSLEEAADEAVHAILRPGHGGIIAVGRDGSIAMPFNTGAMFRGAADSSGRFEVSIWE